MRRYATSTSRVRRVDLTGNKEFKVGRVNGTVSNKINRSFTKVIHSIVLSEDEQNSLMNNDNNAAPFFSASIVHDTSGPVPRSSELSIMLLAVEDANGRNMVKDSSRDEVDIYSLVEESLKWYLDNGGRIGKLAVSTASDGALLRAAQDMGFTAVASPEDGLGYKRLLQEVQSSSAWLFTCNPKVLKQHALDRLSRQEGNAATLNDLLGRISHDMGDTKAGIEYYTAALTISPSSSELFRNLGSAYHSIGNTQMAFASYQQAVQLNPADSLVRKRPVDFATMTFVSITNSILILY